MFFDRAIRSSYLTKLCKSSSPRLEGGQIGRLVGRVRRTENLLRARDVRGKGKEIYGRKMV